MQVEDKCTTIQYHTLVYALNPHSLNILHIIQQNELLSIIQSKLNTIIINYQSVMLHSRKEMAEKDHKAVFARQIVTKNPIFSKDQCEDFFQMFNLYCDNRRQCDVSDILNTARTLGFDKKYSIIFKALEVVTSDLAGQWVDFQTFLRLVTEKVGNPFSEEGRRSMFMLVDPEHRQKLEISDLKRISEQLKYNLNDEQIKEVVNNVAGFGKEEITWQQFNKYIAKKVEKKGIAAF